MKTFFTLFFTLFSIYTFSQTKSKINVVLIGTYHFNNPGSDEAKVKERNILSQENQEALERITNKLIKKYKPSKVFVESDFAKKKSLNEMFNLYKNDKPFYNIDALDAYYKRFYTENEIFQLGFRLANRAKNDSIYPIDYDKVPIRFNLIKSKLEANSTFNYSDYNVEIAKLGTFFNDCLSKNTLENVYKCLNSEEQYQLNKGLYISFLNRINKDPDFFGSDLVSAWYKRNLIMYANIQNQVTTTDKNIIIIVGAGHAAMMEDFIKMDTRFNLIKIDQIL
ncbi:DUF5694 domain-containing protein [Flavobacterium sp. '19STA2R22 D10 B1']|uniref:DUF5694 domain-containing protein n=1 Tax=Flavobacterium aerium TaxID=3037261 RepID=UPI00278C7864|nr:DUF5694 domain-containing protein [Flavobacterium sp. '19STA2R22 D10 B1']